MRVRQLLVTAALLAVATNAAAKEITLGFDGVADLATNVDSNGVKFSGATVLACGGSLNCVPFPPFSGRNVIYDTSGQGGGITATFNQALTGVVSKVSARVTGNRNITMTAFDKNNVVLGTTRTGGANYVGSNTGIPANLLLSLTSANVPIAKATFHDTGNTFTVDDFAFVARPVAVVLDPGHGRLTGDDGRKYFQRPATATYALREDNLTLAMATAAGQQLVTDGYAVYYTRKGQDAPYAPPCGMPDAGSDTIDFCNEDLRLRIETARHLELDQDEDVVFVSVHTNGGILNRVRRGRTQTFYCLPESSELATDLLNAVTAVFPPNTSLFRGGYEDCSYAVLRNTAANKISGSLIEVLYHSNATDEQLLNQSVMLQNAGKAIARGIESFVNRAD